MCVESTHQQKQNEEDLQTEAHTRTLVRKRKRDSQFLSLGVYLYDSVFVIVRFSTIQSRWDATLTVWGGRKNVKFFWWKAEVCFWSCEWGVYAWAWCHDPARWRVYCPNRKKKRRHTTGGQKADGERALKNEQKKKSSSSLKDEPCGYIRNHKKRREVKDQQKGGGGQPVSWPHTRSHTHRRWCCLFFLLF